MTRAQRFARQLERDYGPPLDATNVREIGWRKTRAGKTSLFYEWDTVQGDPNEKPDFVTCPKCGAMMIERNGRYGRFLGCSQYPDCKGTRRI